MVLTFSNKSLLFLIAALSLCVGHTFRLVSAISGILGKPTDALKERDGGDFNNY